MFFYSVSDGSLLVLPAEVPASQRRGADILLPAGVLTAPWNFCRGHALSKLTRSPRHPR